MSKLSRYGQPLATILVALALVFVSYYFRPTTVKVARPIHEPLPDERTTVAVETVFPSFLNTALMVCFGAGIALMFIGSVALIWFRTKPHGRHSAKAARRRPVRVTQA